MKTIRLGVRARDKITGFEGIVSGRAEYLYGCSQWGLTPASKDGEVKSTQYFDEGRIEYIDEGVAPESVQAEKPGPGDSPRETHGLR